MEVSRLMRFGVGFIDAPDVFLRACSSCARKMMRFYHCRACVCPSCFSSRQTMNFVSPTFRCGQQETDGSSSCPLLLRPVGRHLASSRLESARDTRRTPSRIERSGWGDHAGLDLCVRERSSGVAEVAILQRLRQPPGFPGPGVDAWVKE